MSASSARFSTLSSARPCLLRHLYCLQRRRWWALFQEDPLLSTSHRECHRGNSRVNQGDLTPSQQHCWLFLRKVFWSLCSTCVSSRVWLPTPHCLILSQRPNSPYPRSGLEWSFAYSCEANRTLRWTWGSSLRPRRFFQSHRRPYSCPAPCWISV